MSPFALSRSIQKLEVNETDPYSVTANCWTVGKQLVIQHGFETKERLVENSCFVPQYQIPSPIVVLFQKPP